MTNDGSPAPRAARRPVRGALFLGLAVLAAACGGEPAADGGRRPLRIALHADLAGLDPHRQPEAVALQVLGNVYEPLVAFDLNMGLVPWLAERWESRGERVVRFHLRPGVAFHDGRPLTAADVVRSLDRARREPLSRCASLLVAVDEVRRVDARTIELHTSSPYPILLHKLASVPIVPADAPETIVEPVGTGPYRLVAWEPGRRVVLEGWAGHWRGAPAEPAVEYLFESDPAVRLERLLAGELDLIDHLPPREVARVEETPGFQVLERGGLAVTYLRLSPAVEPFSDPRVRRAVDLALDRRALVRDVLAGYGRAVGQMASPNVFGYVEELEPPAPDRREARRLLAAAGYPGGLDVTLEHREGADLGAVRAQLAAAGVRLELSPRPWSELHTRLQAGGVAFFHGSWTSTSGDASEFLDHEALIHEPERGIGGSMELRRAVLERALGRAAADRVFLPLYAPYDLYGARESLAWTPRPDGRIHAFEMERRR